MNNDKFVVRLENLKFYSFIGVFPEERMIGNDFILNISVSFNATRFKSENLDTTISYADIYEIVAKEMQIKWLLLESVAKEIGDNILNKWDFITEISIKIEKVNPPIPGMKGSGSVEYIKIV